MPIRLYNSLTKTKQDFAPIDAKNVRMYVCGPTVYDFAHIGNARPAIVFDVLYRLLRHEYGADHVTYVRNITDVDDKINARALRDFPDLPLNEAIRKVTEKTEAQYHADVDALGCLRPTHEPRATEHIEGMIAMIQTLLDKDHAYVAQGDEGRETLFDIKKMSEYGQLSGRKLEDQLAGARVEAKDYKRNPGDFVLWKESDSDEPGWDATFRISDANRAELRVNSNTIGIHGRPGWHIECSVMSEAFLGKIFDIHGGGLDLIFPHHENEIAQSRCAHGTPTMANVWMHNGFLQVEGEKMSKSLGNFFTIRELLAGKAFGNRSWPGEVLRHMMLKTHYRQPIDWARKSLEESRVELSGWVNALSNSTFVLELEGRRSIGELPRPSSEIANALRDDLNAPEAYKALRELFASYTKGDGSAGVALAESLEFLGLMRLSHMHIYNTIYAGNGPKLLPQEYRPTLAEVQTAVANGNADRASLLKSELAQRGVVIQADGRGRVQYEVTDGLDKPEVERLIAARNAARAAKDFAESDRIRDELLAKGVVLKDGPTGTTWEVKR